MIEIKELPESTKDRIAGEIYIRDNIKVKWDGKRLRDVCSICLKKRPNFNFEGQKRVTHCGDCKLENMINVVTKKCIICNKKAPSFNFRGQKSATHCGKCKEENMIDVMNKKCIVCNKKYPNFNFEREKKATHCNDCKLENMVDVKNKKCIVCNTKRSNFNFEGQKQATHCNDCKLENMIDVKNKKCNSEWCNTRVLNKYKGYCLFCFINLFPDEKVCKNYKTKEKSVKDFILENFPNFTWICDKQIQDGCSRKRPDLLLDLGYQVIIIEIDENQHINYNCENKRIMEISKDLDHRPTIFIRFNPDEYLCENKKITSPWGPNNNGILTIKKSKQKEWNSRLEKLKETVEFWIKEKNKTSKMITIEELFFDC